MISVIIPIYNTEKYLEDCINSVINQSYTDIEIILVNDGSTDSSLDICNDYKLKDDRIKIVNKTNGGLSDARNYGIQNASGDFLFFLDSDDWLKLDALEILYNEITSSNTDMVVFNFMRCADKNSPIDYNDLKLPVGKYTNIQTLSMFENASVVLSIAWSKLYKKELFKDIKFPKGKINEDEFVAHYIIELCENVSIISDELLYYRTTPGSIMQNIKGEKLFDVIIAYVDRIKLLDKYNLEKAKTVQLNIFYKVFAYRYALLSMGNKREKQLANEMYELFLQLKSDILKYTPPKNLKEKIVWVLINKYPKFYVVILKTLYRLK